MAKQVKISKYGKKKKITENPYKMTDNTVVQKDINDEYRIWRKNVPYNYDLLITHALSWPSLTCQWYPTANRVNDSTVQDILLCTHTSGKDQEYILIASVIIPDSIIEGAETLGDGALSNADGKIKFRMEIPVNDEINRARFSPFANHILATRSDGADTAVYDTTCHCNKSKRTAVPDLILKGHLSGGYGVSWNTVKNGEIVTSGEDGLICFYNINSTSKNKTMHPAQIFKEHESVVGDVCFSFYNPNVFVSVGDDRKIVYHDTRGMKAVSVRKDAHASDIFCVHYSPVEDGLLATGGKDSCINIWDERKMDSPVFSLKTEDNEILQVQWSPHIGSCIASAGTDRRVRIWDLNNANVDISKNEAALNDGPAELKFLHSGHTDTVCDFSWNPLEPMEICSVAEDNILQIWQQTSSDVPYDISE
ncbi:hypothetical protein EDEG_02792 [Edhazardia aedis USNM 41457]|uniref:Histone-binding protein RBBP4-like N-terminal domain-containing protein n=1 Tax=Edhazardia aedis (strain USNM 41457) TaxID=1003232 RepID=J8ZT23_EDHAE|nr:hypothetical protein EDEG_02792 [Edhazardia aedis USNM 41457]|eukprot:EJW02818.1 hypothetical protein EDEG_02792 [Edhazardia aedis USNM 41457]